MKRMPIVLAATAAGLATVLGFHTQQMSGSVLSGLGKSGTGSTPTDLDLGGKPARTSTTRPGRPRRGSTLQLHPDHDIDDPGGGTRTALGADVQYRYGELELQVTVTGGRITNVQPAIDTAFDPRSSQINAYAEPLLQSQTLQAQSANINGVSGRVVHEPGLCAVAAGGPGQARDQVVVDTCTARRREASGDDVTASRDRSCGRSGSPPRPCRHGDDGFLRRAHRRSRVAERPMWLWPGPAPGSTAPTPSSARGSPTAR